ncbi:MAG: hypothetical protein B6242_12865 [Anaerolineaceae bacterium 4572_78]|nr:MAG: hypothetical protein B6242_12865 [Anaerolineaceae bacterium 4572_78]
MASVKELNNRFIELLKKRKVYKHESAEYQELSQQALDVANEIIPLLPPPTAEKFTPLVTQLTNEVESLKPKRKKDRVLPKKSVKQFQPPQDSKQGDGKPKKKKKKFSREIYKTAMKICDKLDEKRRGEVCYQISRVGIGPALALLEESLKIQESGGMWTKDKERKRTIGGIWFKIVKDYRNQTVGIMNDDTESEDDNIKPDSNNIEIKADDVEFDTDDVEFDTDDVEFDTDDIESEADDVESEHDDVESEHDDVRSEPQ